MLRNSTVDDSPMEVWGGGFGHTVNTAAGDIPLTASASVVVSTSRRLRRNSDGNLTVAPTTPPSRRPRPPLSPTSLREQKMRQHAQLMMISDDPDVETAGEQLSELMLNTSPSTADRRHRIAKDTIANELPTIIAKKMVIRQLPRPRTAVLSRKKKKRSTSSKKEEAQVIKKEKEQQKEKIIEEEEEEVIEIEC